MRGTNDEIEDPRNRSKKKVILTMSKSTIMQAHHVTENENGKKDKGSLIVTSRTFS